MNPFPALLLLFLLVPLVEEGWPDDPVTLEAIRRYLEPVLAQAVETLVLGCTHSPPLKGAIRRVARELGRAAPLDDSAEAASA